MNRHNGRKQKRNVDDDELLQLYDECKCPKLLQKSRKAEVWGAMRALW
jgi:hypothetical protein